MFLPNPKVLLRARNERRLSEGGLIVADDKNTKPTGYGDHVHINTGERVTTSDGRPPQEGGTVYKDGKRGTLDSFGNFHEW